MLMGFRVNPIVPSACMRLNAGQPNATCSVQASSPAPNSATHIVTQLWRRRSPNQIQHVVNGLAYRYRFEDHLVAEQGLVEPWIINALITAGCFSKATPSSPGGRGGAGCGPSYIVGARAVRNSCNIDQHQIRVWPTVRRKTRI